jgi:hypothetical protein
LGQGNSEESLATAAWRGRACGNKACEGGGRKKTKKKRIFLELRRETGIVRLKKRGVGERSENAL